MRKEPWGWDISDIERLIDDQEKESISLEFKGCGALKRNDPAKKKISKDVSAFANAGGGVMIYGIEEKDHTALEIGEGFDPREISKEWLEETINSRIQRRIEGIRINQISTNKGSRVLYVVYIPQSYRAPHQASDKRFYTRKNFSRVPMEEYEVRDVFMRREAPDVILDLYFSRFDARIEKFPISWKNTETSHHLEINGALRNEGGGEVHYMCITLIADARLLSESDQEEVTFRSLRAQINGEEVDILMANLNWGGPHKMPLFKTVEYRLFEDDLRIQFKREWLEKEPRPFVQWEIRVAGMKPNSGMVAIRKEGENAILKPDEPRDISEILQDGRSRDFLRTPDLSISPQLE